MYRREIYGRGKIIMDEEQVYLQAKGQGNKKEAIEPGESGVARVDKKLTSFQEQIVLWQKRITGNEAIVSLGFFVTGVIITFAVSDCTGVLEVPWYAWILAGLSTALFILLLISDRLLPLFLISKFVLFCILGHVTMDFAIAFDSHYLKFFTYNVCKYPSFNNIIWFSAGIAVGYFMALVTRVKET